MTPSVLLGQALAQAQEIKALREHARIYLAVVVDQDDEITALKAEVERLSIAHAYAEEARREEQKACCEDVCTRCANGSTPKYQSDPRPMWWHEASRCSAAAILARGEKG